MNYYYASSRNGHIHPVYRPDLAHCIYCGAADEYVCTCDHREDMWPELLNDTEIPF